MKRNFILPSEASNYLVHDCRLEDAKYHNRNKIYDVSVLTRLMNKTKSSLNTIYDSYLLHPEEIPLKSNQDNKFPNISSNRGDSTDILNSISNYNTELTDLFTTDKEKEKKPAPNKVIKECILNSNHTSYGNLLWPYSVTSTFSDDIICVDSFEHRLLVFTREFLFKYQIGGEKKGSGLGEFNEPVDATLNEVGKLFVADKNNFRLQTFVEQRKFKESKTKFSQGTKTESSNSKVLKPGSEFTFKAVIKLKDKPVKLTAAPLAPIIAVATEKGYIFTINESNQIMSFIQIKRPFDIFDLKNLCLNESGDQLICLKSMDQNLHLQFYKVEQIENQEASTYTMTNTNTSKTNEKSTTSVLNTMKLLKTVKLESKYMPGICLAKSLWIKLSLDFQNIIVYDSINANLLEYDLNGKFGKILLKAEEKLGHVLAIDFSGDRQHLLVTEFEMNTVKCVLNNFNPQDNNKYKELGMTSHEINMRHRSAMYIFKLKLYRYRECECHRHMDAKSGKGRLNKSAGLNQSFNNFSNTDSESAANFTNFANLLDRKFM